MEGGYFVSPPPLPIVSHRGIVLILFNTSSLRFLAHEDRRRCKLGKNNRGIVFETWNDEDNIMWDWSALPELQITD